MKFHVLVNLELEVHTESIDTCTSAVERELPNIRVDKMVVDGSNIYTMKSTGNNHLILINSEEQG